MRSPVMLAWLLCAAWLFLYAARVRIADLRSSAVGETSFGECCIDSRDGWACDCLIPEREAVR